RLYDTRTSAYITLADIKELVLQHENFLVVDAKTGDDLTRAILLQIILEEESGGVPIFSSEVLSHMIRLYGNAMQSVLGQYLETNMTAFVDFQKKMQGNSNSSDLWSQFLTYQGPAMQSLMSAYMDQSQKMVQNMQSQIQTQARNMFQGITPNK
ncbi:MAG: polyhydroxyalkanoate synthesis repressor PhaR, partial [Fluviibacter sp.]